MSQTLHSLGTVTSGKSLLDFLIALPSGVGGYFSTEIGVTDVPINSWGQGLYIPSSAKWGWGQVLWHCDTGGTDTHSRMIYGGQWSEGKWQQFATTTSGSWTPILEGATTSFLEHQSKYSIIGNVVYFTTNIKVKITAVTGTAAIITGLPVIPDAQVVMCSANTFNIVNRFSGDDGIKASVQGRRIHLSYAANTNDTNWIIPVTNINNFGFLTITGFYYI